MPPLHRIRLSSVSQYYCAFTLIELLVAITVVSILLIIALLMASRLSASVQDTKCLSNLREIGAITLLYCEDNNNRLPKINADPFPVQLWPYANTGTITMSATQEIPPVLAKTIFECPVATKETSPPFTYVRSYGMNASLAPAYPDRASGILVNLLQVPSRTALFADVKNSSTLKPATCNTRHDGRMNVMFVDGHVALVKPTSEISNVSTSFWAGIPE